MVDMSLPALAAGRYVNWGVIQISLTNLLIIVGMVVLFVLALLLPFPKGKRQSQNVVEPRKEPFDGHN
jgi:hypothetical protein